MVGGIRFEHSHRVIAGAVGLLTAAFTLVVFRREKRAWVRRLAAAALGAVVLQALLGGLTVKYLLPLPVSVAHACLAQTFFCLVAALVYVSSPEWAAPPRPSFAEARTLRNLAVGTFAIAYAQLILGALVRHARGFGLSAHYVGAFLILVHLFLTYSKIQRDESARKALSGHAALCLAAASVQILLGFGSFVYRIVLPPAVVPRPEQVLFTTAHQTTGAFLLALILLLAMRAFRLFRSA